MELFSAEGRQSTKVLRTSALTNLQSDSIPETYVSNTNKEELCLEYVRNFDEKFKRLCPNRDALYLVAPNEFGVEKFIPTTLRPTLLPFGEIYDYEDTAAFVANYLHYEPLEVRSAPPSVLPSPTQVMAWRVGDCFDFSMLLCSFLLGAGYDSFVVKGKAPQWVCLRDQSRTECPLLLEEATEASRQDTEAKTVAEEKTKRSAAKYTIPPRRPPESVYEIISKSHDNLAESKNSKTKFWDASNGKGEPNFQIPSSRKLGSSEENDVGGMHCWILVRGGKRGHEGSCFVEATTGKVYRIDNSPYFSIDAMWNARNYFVNMQNSLPIEELSFDILDASSWEYIFIEPKAQIAAQKAARLATETDGEKQVVVNQIGEPGDHIGNVVDHSIEEVEDSNILDIPPSWVAKLVLDRSLLKLKYPPNGQRTIIYLRSKMELFADNIHEQGIISRLTLFKDEAQTIVKECRERFLNRRDRLDQVCC